MTIPVLLGAIVALLTTLFGALVGPALLERRQARWNDEFRRRQAREHPYIEFVNAVERIQLSLDLRAAGLALDRSAYLSEFRQLEEARAPIDLVGTVSTRVWAYRCRLAISGMDRILLKCGPGQEGILYRAKLHEARSNFVKYARAELSYVLAPTPEPTDTNEDSADGHDRWLHSDASANAEEAVRVPYAELSSWGVPALQEPGLDNRQPLE